MKRPPPSFETTVRAFRDLTAAPADGAATRTRVLALAERDAERGAKLRRTSLTIAAALITLSSASLAWTAGARWWRGPAPVALAMESVPTSKAPFGGRPRRVIPSAIDESDADAVPDPARASDEARAYGRAHRAHFADDAPARALAAWDDYLGAYPRGVFAPEARYNRAVCLIRLARLREAARALSPFAWEHPYGYRRTEARLLLDWVRERLDADRASQSRMRSGSLVR